ncbi:unnamed protein product [Schistosoma turkestanicum]|nr:unnamed protein product [Schistosoma turkestanicum]
MDDYQQLKSKYERLCVEFKKLRTKYKTLKDNELSQQLQNKIVQKDLQIEQLKQEIEQLRLINHNILTDKQQIPLNGITHENSTKLSLLLNTNNNNNNDNSNQLSFFTNTVNVNTEAKNSITTQELNSNLDEKKLPDTPYTTTQFTKHNSLSTVTNSNSTTSASSYPSNICHDVFNMHHTSSSSSLVPIKASSSPLSSRIPSPSSLLSEDTSTTTTTLSTASTTTNNNNNVSTTTTSTTLNSPTSSDEDWRLVVETEEKLTEQFVQLLNNWMNSIKTNRKLSIIDKERIDDILINRITQLESQLCEASLQYQLERKRRLKEQQQSETTDDAKLTVHNSQEINLNGPNQLSSSVGSEKSKEISHTNELIMKRLHTAIEESIYFASRANLLQDELESLIPWILQLLHLHQKQQNDLRTMKQYNEQLKQQLELTKLNTVKQVNEMAKHMANLTDELQTLRFSNHHSNGHCIHEQQHQHQSNYSLSNDNQLKKHTTLFNVLKK